MRNIKEDFQMITIIVGFHLTKMNCKIVMQIYLPK